jgi:hypothetical protein
VAHPGQIGIEQSAVCRPLETSETDPSARDRHPTASRRASYPTVRHGEVHEARVVSVDELMQILEGDVHISSCICGYGPPSHERRKMAVPTENSVPGGERAIRSSPLAAA